MPFVVTIALCCYHSYITHCQRNKGQVTTKQQIFQKLLGGRWKTPRRAWQGMIGITPFEIRLNGMSRNKLRFVKKHMQHAHSLAMILSGIVHCSATPEGRDYSIATLTAWHRQRGFLTIGSTPTTPQPSSTATVSSPTWCVPRSTVMNTTTSSTTHESSQALSISPLHRRAPCLEQDARR